jgi:DNA-binding HxlR family transcriptional regulator
MLRYRLDVVTVTLGFERALINFDELAFGATAISHKWLTSRLRRR